MYLFYKCIDEHDDKLQVHVTKNIYIIDSFSMFIIMLSINRRKKTPNW